MLKQRPWGPQGDPAEHSSMSAEKGGRAQKEGGPKPPPQAPSQGASSLTQALVLCEAGAESHGAETAIPARHVLAAPRATRWGALLAFINICAGGVRGRRDRERATFAVCIYIW